ncbi:sulfotransferase domain-containing protein [Alicyclobacillus fodiniaquatilis]|uniref:Sulfotransferase domain-containing protein n=1 Tax=Alicyclobacillus fodiniaquatilis TaxID=1661150 RepID=A0ABW4JKY2_9BACL
MPKKPNFFIAGAAKCGTTSLFRYIEMHPDVFMSRVKEPHYFCSHHFPERFVGPGDQGFNDNTMRTFEAYQALFDPVEDQKIIGEASVYYLNFLDVAQKIYDFNPSSKVIIILRNPIERAFSAYMHTVRDNRETLSFEKALQAEPERKKNNYQPLWWYREIGVYAEQVKRYVDVFGAHQVKIFLYEDLKRADVVVQDMLNFLDLSTDYRIDTTIRHNVSGNPKSRALYNFFAKPNAVKEVIKPFLPRDFRKKLGQRAKNMTLAREKPAAKTVQELKNYFREDIINLQDVVHRDLSSWLL